MSDDEPKPMEVGPEPEPFTLRLEDLFPAPSKPLGQMTRDERLAAKEAERTRRQLSAILNDPAECAAPPQKRRMGHSRRPDWTVRGKR